MIKNSTSKHHFSKQVVRAFMFGAMIYVCFSNSILAQDKSYEPRRFKTDEVFDTDSDKVILYQSNFAENGLNLLKISEDNRYALPKNDPKRLNFVATEEIGKGAKAVEFTVPRKPNSYRSEISLPHENGFQERWYGITHKLAKDWQIDPNEGGDIVMQWHAIPGNYKATNPNLGIAVQKGYWEVRQAFGSPQDKHIREKVILKIPLKPGVWSNWIIQAKWSPKEDGIIKIWKDGELVFEKKGPNAYGTIGVEYTPYLKTGIYHPEWYLRDDKRKKQFKSDVNPVSEKKTYVAKIIIASEKADLNLIKSNQPKLP